MGLDQTFITIAGYEMSYLEFFGTLLNFASVWLVVKQHVLTWPIGIAGSLLFLVLFVDVRLYSDVLIQVYFIVTGFYGWLVWNRARVMQREAVGRLSMGGVAAVLAIGGVGTVGLGAVMGHLDVLLPALISEPAAYPYVDAFQTTLSFIAQILMAHRRIENWVLWIIVDIASIWLYLATGVAFVALLYAFFLVLAVKGLYDWAAGQRLGAPDKASLEVAVG